MHVPKRQHEECPVDTCAPQPEYKHAYSRVGAERSFVKLLTSAFESSNNSAVRT